MVSITAVKKAWSKPSRPRSAPIPSSTASCSPIEKPMETVEDLADHTWEEWAAWAEGLAAVIQDTPKKHIPTERKFWSRSLKRPADDSSKFQKKKPSTKFTPPSMKNFAISTAWDIPRINQTQPSAITNCISPLNNKTCSYRPEMGFTWIAKGKSYRATTNESIPSHRDRRHAKLNLPLPLFRAS